MVGFFNFLVLFFVCSLSSFVILYSLLQPPSAEANAMQGVRLLIAPPIRVNCARVIIKIRLKSVKSLVLYYCVSTSCVNS